MAVKLALAVEGMLIQPLLFPMLAVAVGSGIFETGTYTEFDDDAPPICAESAAPRSEVRTLSGHIAPVSSPVKEQLATEYVAGLVPVVVPIAGGSGGVQGSVCPGGQSQLSLPIRTPAPVPAAHVPPGTTFWHACDVRKLTPDGSSGEVNCAVKRIFLAVL